MAKKTLIGFIIIVVLISAVAIKFQVTPEKIKNAIVNRTSQEKSKEGQDDDLVLDEDDEGAKEPTKDEVLYGETYLDDQRIDIVNNSFSPVDLTIRAGSTVIWTNKDKVNHSVVLDSRISKTATLAYQKSGSILFSKLGKYPYHDGSDPKVKGLIIVE